MVKLLTIAFQQKNSLIAFDSIEWYYFGLGAILLRIWKPFHTTTLEIGLKNSICEFHCPNFYSFGNTNEYEIIFNWFICYWGHFCYLIWKQIY